MSETENITNISRLLSKVLRHEPTLIGISLDTQGWVSVETLLAKLNKARQSSSATKRLRTLPEITLPLLQQIVASNNKQRFSFSSDGSKIRAVQGHSIPVALAHPVLMPPAILYHGTSTKYWAQIAREGLKPGTRHAVHLSEDTITAHSVGARHGAPIVLAIDAASMHEAGFQFTRADNGVWLVDSVPAMYLSLLNL